jgi:hypothetical protein
MNFTMVPLDQIDFTDEIFRISDDLLPERFVNSIQEIGQVNPVVLLSGRSPKFTIVCGFRRLHAMRRLGMPEATARLENGSATRVQLLSTALYDNLSHRTLNCFEQARVLCKLGELGVPEEILVSRYMSALGLKPRRDALDGTLRLLGLSPDLRALFLADRLTETSIQRLAAYSEDVQGSFACLLHSIRLSAMMQRKTLDLIEDLAAMADPGIAGVFADAGLRRILEDRTIPAPQKGEQVHDYLMRKRYPRLSQAREDFQKTRDMLGLPGTIHIASDPYFETQRVRFSFEVSGADQLRSVAAILGEAGNHPLLPGLFSLKERQ